MRPVPKGFPPNSGRFGPCCRRLSPVWPATIPRPLGHSAPQPLYIYSFLAQLGRPCAPEGGLVLKKSTAPPPSICKSISGLTRGERDRAMERGIIPPLHE